MSPDAVAPGAKLGIVGGGQLGRMLAAVAARMGYLPYVLAPDVQPPAAAFAARHVRAEFDDEAALKAFAAEVDVVTFEFENVSSQALAAATEVGLVRPDPAVLHVTQDRSREKRFLARHGLPHVSNRLLQRGHDLLPTLEEFGLPCVVKTAGFGYDGKGQQLIAALDDHRSLEAAAALAAAGPVVVERFIDLRLELSVVGARGADGGAAVYEPIINRHVDHILDLSVTPLIAGDLDHGADQDQGIALSLPVELADQARRLTHEVMQSLDLVGLCCVEFFLAKSGELLINEIAPRPHNSGHLTMEAAHTSQFEQQLRAVCGLTLGSTGLKSYAAMGNLLGDLWPPEADGTRTPNFVRALSNEAVSLHLYGKTEARRGRKMGHLTALGATPAQAVERLAAARGALAPG